MESKMEETVAPIVEQVLQEPPADTEAAALPTEEASGTPAAADPAPAEGETTTTTTAATTITPAAAGETTTTTPAAAAPAGDAADQPAPETAVEAADGEGATTKPAAEAEGQAAAKPATTATATTPTAAPAVIKEDTPTKKPKRKETRKRVRRVGKAEPRKFAKIEPSPTSATGEAAETAATRSEGTPLANRRVLSKHDEKWNNMFDRLLEYKKANNHTLVPQCYHDDPRLGRWVHYQRVEYWIYQQAGTGKITPERIGRLEAINFEWDPQKAQWNIMFDRLVKYKEEVGHCKVPKGYSKDTELANWVRNQRLEQANLKKGKKSRMTTERYDKLTGLGFRWSTSIAKKGTATRKSSGGNTSSAAAAASSTTPATDSAAPPKEDATTKAVEEAVAVAIELGDGSSGTAAATTTTTTADGGETPAAAGAVKAEEHSAVIQI